MSIKWLVNDIVINFGAISKINQFSYTLLSCGIVYVQYFVVCYNFHYVYKCRVYIGAEGMVFGLSNVYAGVVCTLWWYL